MGKVVNAGGICYKPVNRSCLMRDLIRGNLTTHAHPRAYLPSKFLDYICTTWTRSVQKIRLRSKKHKRLKKILSLLPLGMLNHSKDAERTIGKEWNAKISPGWMNRALQISFNP